MSRRTRLPIALTIAGSDSGGGAGLQADLQTFAALGVHGTCALTALTAQTPRGVQAVQPASVKLLRAQLHSLFSELRPAAAKTGMLYSTGLVRAVAEFFAREKAPPLIVDPVMVATSGVRLLRPSALRAVCDRLLPLAELVTPNLDEAELLLERTIRDEEEMRAACRAITSRFGCATLCKGGHLRGARHATDIYYDGRTELLLTAPFVRGVSTHGTGCTYSAAITAFRAAGEPLPRAVRRAKTFITQAILRSHRIGRYFALNWRWQSEAQNERLWERS